jgi:hypothetical protein
MVWREFLLGVTANLFGSLIAALVFYFVFQRAAARLESLRHDRDNRNLITAMLLQQLPVLLERTHYVERDAFRAAMAKHRLPAPHNSWLANEARVSANMLAAVHETATILGVESSAGDDLARSANHLARAALILTRNEDDAPGAIGWATKRFRNVSSEFDKADRWSSHTERLELLLKEIGDTVSRFASLDSAGQCQHLCSLLEAIGHLAILYETVIRRVFVTHIAALREQ